MEFLYGIALAYVFSTGVRWSKATGLTVIALGCGIMIAAQYAGVSGHYWTARCLWMGVPALAVCAGATLMELNEQPSKLKHAFELGGDSSFLLYLSHPFSLAIIAAAWPLLGITSPLAYLLCAGTGALMCAVALHLYLEKPLMAYLAKRFAASSQSATVSTIIPDSMPTVRAATQHRSALEHT
jgi:peptidoglycan/LPS O-acetylase OafA/YrhL